MTGFERRALDYNCPACKAEAGAPCLKQSATNNYWDLHPAKHPHEQRIELARADVRDQGAADWRR